MSVCGSSTRKDFLEWKSFTLIHARQQPNIEKELPPQHSSQSFWFWGVYPILWRKFPGFTEFENHSKCLIFWDRREQSFLFAKIIFFGLQLLYLQVLLWKFKWDIFSDFQTFSRHLRPSFFNERCKNFFVICRSSAKCHENDFLLNVS